jgi:hypothetical protein
LGEFDRLPLDAPERIKDLCAELSSSSDPARVQDPSTKLQVAIHQRIEDLRQRLLDIPAATPFHKPAWRFTSSPNSR